MIGKTISHYKILSKLGEGGMGVVYKAQDKKLDRLVSLKFLPPHLLGSEEEKTRFIHEAKAAASLNHNNICTVYEIDKFHGQTFIAMEYIEGESLKEKIEKGPLKIEEAIGIAIQISQGLNKAHEQGIIHRDIKSANILISKDNVVKITDFGLAKLSGRTQLTKSGSTLGTASYMSPEQTKGEEVDHRTDMWSVGVVLYEMITGQLPFKGDYEQAITYSILNETPESITGLRTGVPIQLEFIANKLLAKNPDDRYQNIEELPVDLRKVDFEGPSFSRTSSQVVSGITTHQSNIKQKGLLWKHIALLTLVAIVFFVAGLILKPLPNTKQNSLFRTYYNLPNEETLGTLWESTIAISPDGKNIAYVVASKGIYIRPAGKLKPTLLPGTERACYPFFSPDGQYIGFFSRDGVLNRISITGSSPQRIADTNTGSYGPTRGATWIGDGTIIYSVRRSGLFRVSEKTGVSERITSPDSLKGEYSHDWPHILPNDEHLIFTLHNINHDLVDYRICLLSLKTMEWDTLIFNESYNARYVSSIGKRKGHIVFMRQGLLTAVPFDLEKLVVCGNSFVLSEKIYTTLNPSYGNTYYNVSNNGTLVYYPARIQEIEQTLILVDRKGVETILTNKSNWYRYPRFSPKGEQVAVMIGGENRNNIWIHNIKRDNQTLLTTEGNGTYPVWRSKSKEILFQSNRSGSSNLYLKRADGTKDAKQLFPSENIQVGGSWSKDGTLLAFYEVHPTTKRDIWIYNALEDTAFSFLNTSFNERYPAISPDGKWIAYQSDKTGRNEIYITPYPGPIHEQMISNNGGTGPVWSRDGRELFYYEKDMMKIVTIDTSPKLEWETPETLFGGIDLTGGVPDYDIHPDGDKFVMIRSWRSQLNSINIVLNWFEELKRLDPNNNK